MRRTCRRDAGRPADINHRCAFRSSHSLYSGLVQGRLQVELLQPLSSNRSRLTVGKRDSSNKASWIQKNRFPNHTPNHARIIPESYLKLHNSEPWYICKIRTCVLWALFATIRHGLHYASCCFWAKSDNSTLQRHPAMAPTCQLQSAHTTLTAAPWSSTLQRHHQPAPERTRHSNSCTLQRAAAPFTSTLAARVGYSTYPPCSTLKHHPLQQHQQASSTAPSSSTFHPHPLTSMPAPKHGLKHTPIWQQHLQTSPSGSTCSSTLSHQHRSKLYTPLWQQATPCTSTLQRHSNGTTMPAPKRTHHSDSSTHSVNSQLQSAPRMV